ncbi:MAG: GMC family oxidoreductase N-terminal domain-containing protein [Solirubrobacterales bacterium]
MTTSVVLSEVQRAILEAVCDTFVPAVQADDDPHGFWARTASDLDVPAAIEERLGDGVPEEQLQGLRDLLDALAAEGFADAGPEGREQLLLGFAAQGGETLGGINAFKSLTMLLFYAKPDPETGMNPNWPAMGYPGPQAPPPDAPRPLRITRPSGEAVTIEADVCVVGSGCGGGVIAGELAAAGRKVCVLETGGYLERPDFNQLELWAYKNMYLAGGPFRTTEGQVTIQAGSTLGGGSVINWMNCLRTPAHVRKAWASDHGLEGLDGDPYDEHLDAIWERLQVNDGCSDLNGPHQRLQEGCDALGYDFRLITRNEDPDTYDPKLAGYTGYGDQSGAKQSTSRTYLHAAQEHDAQLVADCHAQRILVEDGRAAGVHGILLEDGVPVGEVTVQAPQVVVAAGSVASPALLLRSEIGGPAAGNYLRLHPATAIFGLYDDDQQAWWGAPQAALSHEFADLGDGYGFLVECPHTTTGITGSAVTWDSGADHKQMMSRFSHMASFISVCHDRGHGKVSIDAEGNPAPAYGFTDDQDRAVFRRSLTELAKLHRAAGAKQIVSLGRTIPRFNDGEDFDAFLSSLESADLAPFEHGVFSAHQMGSCRMGNDPETSVANPWGELHDTPGVWIGDASAFPTASGVNPMITVMALARRTAHAMADA